MEIPPVVPPLDGAALDELRRHHHVVAGAGPVGRAVVAELVRLGVTPTVVTRSGSAVPGATARRADLADPVAAKQALADADVLYQCSQPAYHRWPEEFPALQRSIVDAVGAAGGLVVATENVYGYGPVDGPLHETLPLAATTRKGRVRAEMWRALEDAHRTGQVRAVAARAADFYGPGVTASMLGDRFFEPLLAGRGAEVVGDPDRVHSVTYVPDLGTAMVRLGADAGAWGRAWHAPNAPAVTTTEIVRLAAQLAGVDPKVRRMPRWKLRVAGPFIPAARETIEMLYEFEEDFVVDSARYVERYGAAATPLAEGLRRTIEWYRGAGR